MVLESHAKRRAFLLGMTLNELVFLLFFLLILVSAAVVKRVTDQLDRKTEESRDLGSEVSQLQRQLDATFRKLVLQEALLEGLSRLDIGADPEDPDGVFRRLVELRDRARRAEALAARNEALREQVQRLERPGRIGRQVLAALGEAGKESDAQTAVAELLADAQRTRRERRDLEGRVAYLSRRLNACRGSGLDHPPCWADPTTGAVEYLLRVTLYEDSLGIEPAWPEHRQTEAEALPGVPSLVYRTLTRAEFGRHAQPLLDWSRHRGCRHFVRVRDDDRTSKRAFKEDLLTIEAYFYKYLER